MLTPVATTPQRRGYDSEFAVPLGRAHHAGADVPGATTAFSTVTFAAARRSATGRAYRAVKIVTGPSNTHRRVPAAAIRAGC